MMIRPDLTLIMTKFHDQCCDADPHNSDTEVYVFPQSWPNTGGGLAEPGYCYGQAFTRQYTTVIISERHDVAQVYFDNTLGYTIHGLTDRFWIDLGCHTMRDKGRSRYYAINDSN